MKPRTPIVTTKSGIELAMTYPGLVKAEGRNEESGGGVLLDQLSLEPGPPIRRKFQPLSNLYRFIRRNVK